MNTLRLEELESRDLLSGSYVLPQSRFSASSLGDRPTGLMERPAVPAIGAGARAMGMDGEQSGPYLGMFPQVFTQVQEQVVVELIIVIEVPTNDIHATTPATDSGTSLNITASAPKPVATDAGTDLVALVDTSAAHAPTTAKAAAQSTFAPPPAANVPALAAEVPGPITAQSSARNVRSGDAVVVPGSVLLSQIAASTGVATQPVTEGADPVEAKPSEQPSALPALLSAMPAVDLTVLGRGLDQFMHRLERAGEKLVGDGEGLRPWLVAAAAAATACEIARRQMRRTYDRERAAGPALGTTTDV